MTENTPTPTELIAEDWEAYLTRPGAPQGWYESESGEEFAAGWDAARRRFTAERDALAAILAEAGHGGGCALANPYSRLGRCDCWKSKLPADALAARDAGVRRAERNRIVSLLIGPAAHLADSVRAFKAGWHDADMRGRTGDRVASGLRNVVQDRIESEARS